MSMEACVLRLGHRIFRDQRITSHCALVARAFGASKGFYSGEKDEKLEESIKDVVKRWGGPFEIEYVKDWRKLMRNWEGKIVHLTMYGLPIKDKIGEIKKRKENLLIVIGSEKVSGDVYQLSDWNVAVTSQPHSEVAALAIFLDGLFEGKKLEKEFEGAKLKIMPQERGKKIIEE